jgi:hypothetical protein
MALGKKKEKTASGDSFNELGIIIKGITIEDYTFSIPLYSC